MDLELHCCLNANLNLWERKVKVKGASKQEASVEEDYKSKFKKMAASAKSVSGGEEVEHEIKSKRKQVERDTMSQSKSVDDSSQDDQTEDSYSSESGEPNEVLKERRSKLKNDQMVESKVPISEDDTSLEKRDEKTTMVELPSSSTSNNLKGTLVIETSNKQLQPVKEAASGKFFQKMFSCDDEIKILEMMSIHGDTGTRKTFWREQMGSMRLSIPVNDGQLYEKARRLKIRFLKTLKKNSNVSLDDHDSKVYELCDMIWGKEERDKLKKEQNEKKLAIVNHQPQVKGKKHKEKNEVVHHSHVKKVKGNTMDMEYKPEYDKFLIEFVKGNVIGYPFDEAMKAVPVSMRSSFEKRWLDMYQVMMDSYRSLANEIHEARLSSS